MRFKISIFIILILIFFIFTGCPSVKEKVATPTFDIPGGTYPTFQSVKITCATEGATIYITTDGTDPTTSSTVYDGTFVFMGNGTLKAMAAKSGYDNSDIASATYTLNFGSFNLDIPWNRLIGGSLKDEGLDITSDSSENIYVTGRTLNSLEDSNLGTQNNNGKEDIFIVKYDYKGFPLWVRVRGGSENDGATAIAVDSSDNVYIAGYTASSFDGNTNNGKSDIFVMKYNSFGTWQWTKYFGGSEADEANDIVVGSDGYIYVTGYTKSSFNGQSNTGGQDLFVLKLDSSNGNPLNTIIYGTPDNECGYGIGLDSGKNIIVCGTQLNSDIYQYADIYLVKFNPDGSLEWSIQKEIPYAQVPYALAIDSHDNIYITGYTEREIEGQILKGGKDIFLISYDLNNNLNWVKLIGGLEDDYANDIYFNDGYLYIVGHTKSSFNNQTNHGGYDIVIMKYDTSGNHYWSLFKGGTLDEGGYGIAVSNDGKKIYAVGSTKNSFNEYNNEQINNGDYDCITIKYRLE